MPDKRPQYKARAPKTRRQFKATAPPVYTPAYRTAREVRSSPRWAKLSRRKRTDSPICEWCESHATEEVHHIQGVAAHPELAFDYENLQSLCTRCHRLLESAIRRDIDVEAIKAECQSHLKKAHGDDA